MKPAVVHRRVFDCVTFFNEVELLEIRLNVLRDIVDFHLIVEATVTHQGVPKPLVFPTIRDRFSPFLGKIKYFVVDNPPMFGGESADRLGNHWEIENWQRAALSNLLVDCHDEDVLIFSDIDEIPRPECVKKNLDHYGVTTFVVENYNFFLDFKSTEPGFPVVKMLPYAYYRDVVPGLPFPKEQNFRILPCYRYTSNPNKVRALPGDKIVRRGGWHFSYVGGIERVMQKRRAIAEQHYNYGEMMSPDWVARRIREGRDIYGRGYIFRPVVFGLPLYLRKNKDRYCALFWSSGRTTEKICLRLRWFVYAMGHLMQQVLRLLGIRNLSVITKIKRWLTQ